MEGREIMYNRQTSLHLDHSDPNKGWAVLIVVGPFQGSVLHIPCLNLHLQYMHGNIIIICGHILSHEVEAFSGGQCMCIAHFTHKACHPRTNFDLHDNLDDEQAWEVGSAVVAEHKLHIQLQAAQATIHAHKITLAVSIWAVPPLFVLNAHSTDDLRHATIKTDFAAVNPTLQHQPAWDIVDRTRGYLTTHQHELLPIFNYGPP
ncbi:hypothetical protein C8R44DRAFT_753514 [Mycena epipterygia]|nr:hypothetical protein C8R44DRAFT_753514 [Mycena epipterygia]